MQLVTDGPEGAALCVALAHGAGSGLDTPFMTSIAHGLAERGLRVVRFEFPYMAKRRADGKRRGPDAPRVLRSTWHDVVATLGAERLVIGGKSMGGRVASLVADDARVRGLVCLGYPFHPPGSPDKLRTAHLEHLQTPALILQGTRDRFGTPEEVAGYALSDRIRVHWIEDGDHSFKPRARSGRTLEQNLDEAADAVASFVAAL